MKACTLYFLGLIAAAGYYLVSCTALPGAERTGNAGKPDSEVQQADGVPVYEKNTITGNKVIFNRIGGYVLEGYEDLLNYDYPLTDIGYFSADVDCYGKIIHVPDRTRIPAFPGSVYLVTTCGSRALTHFILDPQYQDRDQLIAQLSDAAARFDGVQIDYEYVPNQDGAYFVQFLSALKNSLSGKFLSVCVPARVRTIEHDVYSYGSIASIADSVVVMAYDEHWSASEPGSVASMAWCRQVAAYALSQIPSDKLVMGIPFYGRSWGSVKTDKAWIYPSISELMKKQNIRQIHRDDGIPYFRYKTDIDVVCWFEDAYSIVARSRMYAAMGIKNISFWRIGQEDREIWAWLAYRP